jgi:hypothetical protein
MLRIDGSHGSMKSASADPSDALIIRRRGTVIAPEGAVDLTRNRLRLAELFLPEKALGMNDLHAASAASGGAVGPSVEEFAFQVQVIVDVGVNWGGDRAGTRQYDGWGTLAIAVSERTYHRWREEYAGLTIDEARRSESSASGARRAEGAAAPAQARLAVA